MNIKRTTEQEMLKDSVEKFCSRSTILKPGGHLRIRRWVTAQSIGPAFAELGWLSVPFAQEHGGFGGTMLDIITPERSHGQSPGDRTPLWPA